MKPKPIADLFLVSPAWARRIKQSRRIGELIETANARLACLLPCSSDLNPIELIFADVEHSPRSPASRTRDALWDAMQSVLDQVTPEDAVNCYKHCGCTLHMN